MKTADYWKQRFEALNQSLLNMGDQYYYDEVEKQFRLATREIEKEISMWYKRLAANNDISMADAKALLVGKDLQEFRWTVEDYIKHGQESGISGKWAKELENASAKTHITQLDALTVQMQQQLEVLYGNQVDGLDQRLKDIYSEGFYKTAYELDKGMGVGAQLRQFDRSQIEKVISNPWCSDGKTFSDRLWQNKDELNTMLQTGFSQAMIRGDGLDKVVQEVTKRMDVATSAAARLVMTESAFFATAGQRDCFDALDVKKYEFVATLDDRTSPECQAMDGKVFNMADMQPGVNAPPLHCWCRSCIVPYFGDKEGQAGARAARGDDGKTKQVPAKLSYSEWKKNFVKPSEATNKTIDETRQQKYNEGVRTTYQKALDFGKRTGNEGLYWIDSEGKSAYPDLTGDSNSVQFTPDLVDFISKAPAGSLTCIHNHPGSSAFSDADLNIMCRFPSIDCLRVIGHDGTKYYASVAGGERPDYQSLHEIYEKAIQDLMKQFLGKVQSGELDKEIAWKEHTHQAISKVAKKFKWNYERTLPDEKG